ncbi:MAG: hypothetical protein R6T83_08515, partial [Salinibacter sp.]
TFSGSSIKNERALQSLPPCRWSAANRKTYHVRRSFPLDMSQLEYLVAILSIIVGLALTDLARSLREPVRPDRTVRWNWLPSA